jgi:ATP-dependent Zn protease
MLTRAARARHAGADLANLLNEAAILAGRRNRKSISLREVDDSVDRIVAGMEGRPLTDGKAKSLVAYHEVGHAVCGTLTPGHDVVQKARPGPLRCLSVARNTHCTHTALANRPHLCSRAGQGLCRLVRRCRLARLSSHRCRARCR